MSSSTGISINTDLNTPEVPNHLSDLAYSIFSVLSSEKITQKPFAEGILDVETMNIRRRSVRTAKRMLVAGKMIQVSKRFCSCTYYKLVQCCYLTIYGQDRDVGLQIRIGSRMPLFALNESALFLGERYLGRH